jgi:hypothetical protein
LRICIRLSLRRAAYVDVAAARSRKSGYAPVGMTILLQAQALQPKYLAPGERNRRSEVSGCTNET